MGRKEGGRERRGGKGRRGEGGKKKWGEWGGRGMEGRKERRLIEGRRVLEKKGDAWRKLQQLPSYYTLKALLAKS
jgi:hypothetical protein